ncbi:MAG: hypothetical protein RL757_2049 [Bacteroidota bacterium]|jgi:hypothetical protein
MKTIHALLIAVDEYAVPAHNLFGCKNDATAFGDYLEQFAAAHQFNFRQNRLFDRAATRAAVIENFKTHFKEVKKDDVAVIFYSGHGSQMPAPPECWEESDGMLETMVLHDSRLANGRDLADKEFASLLYDALNGKGAHVLVVTDCCHAGGNTRAVTTRSRMAPPNPRMLDFATFQGFDTYEDTPNGKRPPALAHLQLAAARADQTAKETDIDGKPRGIFTATLLETLQQSGGQLNYDELIERLGARVGLRSEAQNPQLFSYETSSRIGFLGQTLTQKMDTYSMTFDANRGWVVSAGQIQGVSEGSVFGYNGGVQQLRAVAVSPSDCVVEGQGSDMKNFDKNLQFELQFLKTPSRLLSLGFDEKCKKQTVNWIATQLSNGVFPMLKRSDTGGGDLVVRPLGNALILTRPDSEVPLFRRIEVTGESSISAFLSDVQTVALWYERRAFTNPNTSLADDCLKIEVQDAAEMPVLLDKNTNSYVFRQPSLTQTVGMVVKITNQSDQDLWISAVNFGSDFGIDNSLLARELLAAGATTFIKYKNRKALPLSVRKEYQNWNINEVLEYFKIFASNVELQTSFLNQDGLPLDVSITKRLAIGDIDTPIADWRTFDFAYSIVCDLPSVSVTEGKNAAVSSLEIVTPKGFSANAAFNSTANTKRSLTAMRTPNMLGFEKVTLNESVSNTSKMDVLELENVQKGALSRQTPLKINVTTVNEPMVALAFDPVSELWIPVGTGDKGKVEITTLPEPSMTTRSLGGSIKIFFQKLIIKPLTGEFDYPLLRLAQFNDDFTHFEYVSDKSDIVEKVAAAQHIFVFIHGIIGDTEDMPNVLSRIRQQNTGGGANFADCALLTFDYESLGTTITDTAGELKRRLENIGLTAGHGKTVEIIAHSMGGLVSRYFIEKLDGNQIVTRLIQLGTPNLGSELSDIANMVKTFTTMAANSSAVTGWLGYLAKAGNWIFGKMLYTLSVDMNPKSEFLKTLNDGTDPKIPYFIIAGNTSLISTTQPEKATFIRKIINNLQQRGVYEGFDLAIFQESNDIAVKTASIENITEGKKRQFPTVSKVVASDHVSYFIDPDSYSILGEVLKK